MMNATDRPSGPECLRTQPGHPYEGRASQFTAGNIIQDIGKKAHVVVAKDKFASAHDLRRSFGSRWSLRVLPAILQQMMRHESITTTMDYYVGREADLLNAQIRASLNVGATSDLRACGTPEEVPQIT